MVGRVAWAAMLAGAGRLATAFVDQSQSGSKDGAFRRHLLEAAVDHALDDGRLAWHVHSNPRGSLVYSNYTRKSAKNHGCEEKIANRGKQVTQAQSKLRLAQLQRCDKSLVPQSCRCPSYVRPVGGGYSSSRASASHGYRSPLASGPGLCPPALDTATRLLIAWR